MKVVATLLGAVVVVVAVAWLARAGPFERGRGGRAAVPAPVAAEPASRFADSVGVNIHLFFGDTSYANFEGVRARLHELGVRWIRDGVCGTCPGYVDRLRTLGADGIRAQLLFGAPSDGLLWFQRELATVRSRLLPVLGALEGPNEYDASPDPEWAGHVRAWQTALHRAVRTDPALRGVAVVGPSLIKPESRAALGDLSDVLDAGNLHPYTGGLMPTTAHVDDERRLAAAVSGPKPLVATEGGFHTALRMAPGANQPPVDEAAQADYLPRMFLDHFVAGVSRTFAYELIDTFPDPADAEAERHFGMLRSDLSPKPAFTALRNLLAVLRRGGGHGRRRALRLGLDEPSDGHHLLLSQGDGSFTLVLWRDVPAWNTVTRRRMVVAPEPVRLRLATPIARAETIVPAQGTAPVATRERPAALEVPVAAAPVVVRLTPQDR